MQLTHLVERVIQVRATTKKTEKISLLADFLRQTHGKETELAALYLSGSLPQGKIGIGWRMIEEAMPEALSSGEKPTLLEIDRVFESIASDQGPGSLERKIGILHRLFERANPEERRFMAQLIIGELRQGALERLVLEAIAKASGLPAPEVRQAWMFSGNIGEIALAALEEGASGLSRFSLRLFMPIAPMLANSADNVGEALERLGEAAFEFKLDGARIQIHKGGDEVQIFTRQLQEVTERLPEVVEWTHRLPAREAILEGEAIALRPDGKPHPFQTTMRRFGRTKDVEAMRQEIPLAFFFFDCLHLEAEGPLLQIPYQKRYEVLKKTLSASVLLSRIVTGSAAEAEQFFQRSLASGHEGLMAKSLTAPYIAGHRGFHWLKLKTAKTLDLVILAAEWEAAAARAGYQTFISERAIRKPAATSCWAKLLRASRMRCSDGRPKNFCLWRRAAMTGPCRSVPSWWSKSRSAISNNLPAIRQAWRFVLPA